MKTRKCKFSSSDSNHIQKWFRMQFQIDFHRYISVWTFFKYLFATTSTKEAEAAGSECKNSSVCSSLTCSFGAVGSPPDGGSGGGAGSSLAIYLRFHQLRSSLCRLCMWGWWSAVSVSHTKASAVGCWAKLVFTICWRRSSTYKQILSERQHRPWRGTVGDRQHKGTVVFVCFHEFGQGWFIDQKEPLQSPEYKSLDSLENCHLMNCFPKEIDHSLNVLSWHLQ